ncbi:ATP-dependent metallopeptidase FtsH/Yme1/Tma family protein [uncultured Megasphaera sp.]|uniref:ATP-dependent metallopeptidase FtsH/Yme1/Tma family protein n=1 Tax=uncultured Megasphaera sp. TaxID=165188 RepID=UPI0026DD82DA|nr:FtsH/Yme1/Tma family ATP-dependent metallopeptidase [uncultured Megasphaera sp.]
MKEVKEKKKPILFYYIVALAVIFMFNAIARPYYDSKSVKQVDYGTFMNMTEDEKIADVQIEENQILFKDKDGNEYRTGVVNDPQLTERLHKANVSFNEVIKEKDSPFTDFLIAWILPILIFFGVGYYFNRKLMNRSGGNSLMFGAKNQVKVYVPSANGIHFDDVAGEDEAKENLSEIVDFLHHPDKYAKIGAKMPKGVLLVGPPGTGKTMLAKAVAGEAGVPFFPIAGSEFVEMFVGMGASKVRDLFQQAKQKAPCIIFIDEIDAIGQKRTGNAMGNSEREQTLNQLLTEMDGFNADDNVVILAATNWPESLDPALLRPGRFDRRVPVELPDLAGREAILKAHAKKVALGDDVDFHTITRMAAGASGAELANIVNEAALRAVRDHRDAVSQADLEESIEVVIAGYQKKNAILSDDEKKTVAYHEIGHAQKFMKRLRKKFVAYHEIGHALVAALQSHSAPVQKITIIPRTSGALGYTMQVDQQDKYILSREELENKIATLTGGRAAEEVVFNQVTTGASNDIEQATKLARAMITRYGMTDEFDMVAMETVTNKYLGGDTSLACAPETQKYIDAKVVSVVKEQHAKAKKILEDHRPALDALAKYLYEKETITGKEFMDILRAQTAVRD